MHINISTYIRIDDPWSIKIHHWCHQNISKPRDWDAGSVPNPLASDVGCFSWDSWGALCHLIRIFGILFVVLSWIFLDFWMACLVFFLRVIGMLGDYMWCLVTFIGFWWDVYGVSVSFCTASEEPQPKLTEIVNSEQRCTEIWWFP